MEVPEKGTKLQLMNRKFSDFIEKFDIIKKGVILLRLKDLRDRKVKIKEVMEGIFGLPIEELRVTRTGLYGWKKGWITPMDLI